MSSSSAAPRVAQALAASAAALVVALASGALLIVIAGGSPTAALTALLNGAFGSADAWSEVGVRTCPLLLAGLAVALAFRAGIWNIGADGQLLVGAIMATWIGTRAGGDAAWLMLPFALVAAALGGALWAGIAGVLRTARGVDEVISTIMLNFIALGLLGWLVHGPLMEAAATYPQSDPIALAARLPRLFSGYRLHAGIIVAVLAALAVALLLFRTVLGFEMRAVGLNPLAARLAGLRTTGALLRALALSGALAGLAGGIEVCGVTYRLYDNFSPGYGYTAIAVALLGRLHPLGVVAAALFFGALDVGSLAMQRAAGVSSVLVSALQAIVIFTLLALERRRRVVANA
ncbi:MAG: ABC transporter permease [Deltaproteobacteria bacterium]|nr:ABC transporter permease [Deltaproteobacteria bacterium]